MGLTKQTASGKNYLERDTSQSEALKAVTAIQSYEKQVGSDGAGNTDLHIFRERIPYWFSSMGKKLLPWDQLRLQPNTKKPIHTRSPLVVLCFLQTGWNL
jgi:CO dehydrogenase/acetyl-CoA synthase epsilon subunit